MNKPWPLQKLLDVTVLREQAARSELAGLVREQAAVRRRLSRDRAIVRKVLDELAAQPLAQRLANHESMTLCLAGGDEQIRRLEQGLEALRVRHAEQSARYVQIKAKREMLERLREQAMEAERGERARREQKQLDEVGQVRFFRQAGSEPGRCASVRE